MLEVRRGGEVTMVLKETRSSGCKFSGALTLKKEVPTYPTVRSKICWKDKRSTALATFESLTWPF